MANAAGEAEERGGAAVSVARRRVTIGVCAGSRDGVDAITTVTRRRGFSGDAAVEGVIF